MPTTPTVVTIGGVVVDTAGGEILPHSVHLKYGRGIDTFTFSVRGGPMPGTDPYLSQTVTVEVNGRLRFSGDVVSRNPDFEAIGYDHTYQCLGLRNRGDWVAVVNDNDVTDTILFNETDVLSPTYLASRAGRTVGQILTTVLTQTYNAGNLDRWGIGNYTSLTPPTLPSQTVTDLAALTVIPPYTCAVQGEHLLSSIESFLSNAAPNHVLYIEPDGTIRFVDQRACTNHVFTLDTDPIEPVCWTRDTSECFSSVRVKGQPLTVAVMVKLSDGTLLENFAHDGLSNSAAKSAWTPADWTSPTSATDQGTCTCPTTTTVTVTSSDASVHWASNFWDQSTPMTANTGHQGVLYLTASSLSGLVTQQTSRKIIANTALTAGGTSTLTLDYPLTATSYDSYFIHGNALGNNIVYRNYKVANTAIGAAMARQFNYPVPFLTGGGTLVELVDVPTSEICHSSSGSPPYTTVPLEFSCDPTTGTILFTKPTALVFGGGSTTTPPSEIRVLLAVQQSSNNAYKPDYISGVQQFEGTFFTVDLASDTTRAKTLVVMCPEWKDSTNQANMDSYAQDLLDSVKDTVIEGSVVYHGLYEPALSVGTAATVTGATFTTGFETCTSFGGHPGCPVREVELEWHQDVGVTTTLHCSNRRSHYSSSQFLRPNRQYLPLGIDNGQGIVSPLGVTDSTSFGLQDYANRGLLPQPSQTSATQAVAQMNQGIAGALGDMNSPVTQGLSDMNVMANQGVGQMNDTFNQGVDQMNDAFRPTQKRVGDVNLGQGDKQAEASRRQALLARHPELREDEEYGR